VSETRVIPGYVRAHLLMTEHELADTKDRLAHFAESEGYTLGTVYVERIDRAPAAFGALIEAVERDQPEAIVIPCALHLAVLGLHPRSSITCERSWTYECLWATPLEPAEPEWLSSRAARFRHTQADGAGVP